MDDLVEFLNAMLDEDEAALRDDDDDRPGEMRFADMDERTHRYTWRFAENDRVKREVAAKRRILDDYRIAASACQNVTGADIDTAGYSAMCAGRDALKSCVTQMATVWSDHPGYQEAWKP